MIRLFVGLDLPKQQRERLGILRAGMDGARWVEPENYHITLRFLGDLDEDIAEDVARALETVRGKPFEVALSGLGTFGHPPHDLWVGVQDQSGGALAALQAKVESVVVRAGLKPEGRKFTPHLTLARIKKARSHHLASFIESHIDLRVEPFEVTSFTLFQSHLSHLGAHYERVADFEFTA